MRDTRKIAAALAVLLTSAVCAFGQGYYRGYYGRGGYGGQRGTQIISNVTVQVLDSLTNEALSFASVYLIPKNDTIISNFIVTDPEGKAELKEVALGGYTFCAEFTGYKMYKKEIYVRKNMDLGVIKLMEDKLALEAATVTAVGNPVIVKKDTIEFTASSFLPSENAMLGDLLKRMPGIEVDESGNVTVNGESVKKITVGGKTFFFDDPSMAVNNLPAKIVEKVRVIDKKSDESEFSGIEENEKEKVMDLSLNQQYRKGWFGHVKANAGSTLHEQDDNGLADNRGLLYNNSLMVSGYTEHDQITGIGSIYNANSVNGNDQMPGGGGGGGNTNGLSTFKVGGLNFNTDRIKGYESNAMVSFKSNVNENRSRSARTTFREDDSDQYTDNESTSVNGTNGLSTRIELKNTDRRKYMLNFTPSFSFNRNSSDSESTSENRDDSGLLNSSSSRSSSNSDDISAGGGLVFGLKNLGNARRSFNIAASYNAGNSDGQSTDLTETFYATTGTTQVKDLNYLNDNSNQSINAGIQYTEPLFRKMAVQFSASSSYSTNDRDKAAFNPDGSTNDYYSSVSNSKYFTSTGRVLLQYQRDNAFLNAGFQMQAVNNETFSKSLGVETITGKDEWQIKWAPSVGYHFNTDNGFNLNMDYNGTSVQQNQQSMIPTLNISNPTRLSAGNIYLKPGFDHSFRANVRRNNREKFSFYNLNFGGSYNTMGVVNANWFDKDGIQYSIPVNSRKPSYSGNVGFSCNVPLDKDRKFTVSANITERLSRSVSYQSKGRLRGLDINNFEYSEFMDWFWGKDDEGELFYSGESGFEESLTNTSNTSARLSFRYRITNFEVNVGAQASNHLSKYSVNPDSDLNTWNNSVSAEIFYTTPHNFEINTDCRYTFYRGYAAGYGDPITNWNLTVNKNINAFVVSLRMSDILNQARSLRHTTSENYVMDSYSVVLGRYIMVGLTWNFGKMNAARGESANGFMREMSGSGFRGMRGMGGGGSRRH